MDDDGDLHEGILHIEAHIEELADVIESCRWNLDLGNNHRSGRVRSYGHDWAACGCYRRDCRLWVKHEYFEANYDRHESRRGAQSRVDQQNGSSGGRRRAGGMRTMIQNQLDRGDARI